MPTSSESRRRPPRPCKWGRRGGGRHRRADPGPHGRLTVKLDGPPQQRLQHAHRGSKRGRLHLTLAANPWNIVRTYNLTPGQELLFACRCTCPRPTTSTTHCTAASRETRAPGARPRCASQCLRTELQSHFGGGGHGGFGPAAEARVPRRRGRRRHAGHPGRGAAGAHARKFFGALQQPELRGLGQLHGEASSWRATP